MNNEEVDFRPDGFHDVLDSELGTLGAPPLGDLVGEATRRGRRQRRLRAAAAGVGSVTAVAVLAVLVSSLGTGPGQTSAVGPAAGPASSAPVTSTTPTTPVSPTPVAPTGPMVPATSAALLAAVVQSLPAGLTTDHHAANPARPNAVDVFAHVTTPAGIGRIGVSAYLTPEGGSDRCWPDPTGPMPTACSTSPAGDVVEVQTNPRNCIQATRITVHRPTFNVAVDISSCLRTEAEHAVPALTEQQAVALASSPLVGLTMPSSFVEAANAKYPALPSP
ncbi:hypothetical protein KCMC57_up12970 [Kitasatospora sp. CMC57]|uniref:Uncharacterized protein n=1 Tax=Kitasatospora sp. CMC57 TaxID=3231513 RepID=A0AB33K068_9ACTN